MLTRRQAIITLIVLAAIVPVGTAQTHQVFTMDATIFKNDTVTVHELETTNGSVKTFAPEGAYNISLFDDGEHLYSDSFALTFTTIYFERGDGMTDGARTTTDRERRIFRLPYEPEATEIRITKSGERIFEVSLEDRFCGADGSCPSYCRQGDRWQDDPDCEQPSDTGDDGSVSYVSLLAGIILFVLAVVVYVVGIRGEGDEQGEKPSPLR